MSSYLIDDIQHIFVSKKRYSLHIKNPLSIIILKDVVSLYLSTYKSSNINLLMSSRRNFIEKLSITVVGLPLLHSPAQLFA
ncbi:MAG: hypothetical protein ABJJ05_02125, partial [Maribacter litoralis]|uniref:hypothetical protein n=1 Tax=Maribacter litoralis TaxID=2059726 RepID=UPI003298DB2F